VVGAELCVERDGALEQLLQVLVRTVLIRLQQGRDGRDKEGWVSDKTIRPNAGAA
jgi:hypothetical protein